MFLNFSDSILILQIYWPHNKKCNLDDLILYLAQKTIITEGLNASLEEWNSQVSDKRGKVWHNGLKKNNLTYILASSYSSKYSLRNIDFTFSNIERRNAETICFDTSDY